MAEIQDNGGKKKGSKQKKNEYSCRFYSNGGYEYVADNFLYVVYFIKQTPDDGNQYAL